MCWGCQHVFVQVVCSHAISCRGMPDKLAAISSSSESSATYLLKPYFSATEDRAVSLANTLRMADTLELCEPSAAAPCACHPAFGQPPRLNIGQQVFWSLNCIACTLGRLPVDEAS